MSGSGKKTKGWLEVDRLISFSKCRSRIYKKASELAALCGSEIGFIVFSPAGKPFSFGHPSIESVANRFLHENPAPNDNTNTLVEALRKGRINQISQQLNEVLSQLDAAKETAKAIDQLTIEKETHGWWETPIDQLNQKELQELYTYFEDLRNNLYSNMNKKSVGATSSLLAPMDPAQLTNPFTTNANEEVPYVFPLGYGHGHQQL